MKTDPVIDRIRNTRSRISEECGHDPKKLVEYYMDKQKMPDQRSAYGVRGTAKKITA